MLYLPNKSFLQRYRLLTWPLPGVLMAWLYERRGLGVYILPQDRKLAEEIVHHRIRIPYRKLSDGRKASETAHYCVRCRVIVIPYSVFWGINADKIILHEVGHAFDYLWSKGGHLLSSRLESPLRGIPPLSDYCAETDKLNGNNVEQFATAFSLYFQEPEEHRKHNVDALGPRLTRTIRKFAILPFEDQDG